MRRSNELGDDVTPDGRRRALVPRTVVDKLGNQRRVELTSLRHHCTAPPWSPVSPACFSVSVSACLPLPHDLTRTCRSVAYSRDFARHAYDFRSKHADFNRTKIERRYVRDTSKTFRIITVSSGCQCKFLVIILRSWQNYIHTQHRLHSTTATISLLLGRACVISFAYRRLLEN